MHQLLAAAPSTSDGTTRPSATMEAATLSAGTQHLLWLVRRQGNAAKQQQHELVSVLELLAAACADQLPGATPTAIAEQGWALATAAAEGECTAALLAAPGVPHGDSRSACFASAWLQTAGDAMQAFTPSELLMVLRAASAMSEADAQLPAGWWAAWEAAAAPHLPRLPLGTLAKVVWEARWLDVRLGPAFLAAWLQATEAQLHARLEPTTPDAWVPLLRSLVALGELGVGGSVPAAWLEAWCSASEPALAAVTAPSEPDARARAVDLLSLALWALLELEGVPPPRWVAAWRQAMAAVAAGSGAAALSQQQQARVERAAACWGCQV